MNSDAHKTNDVLCYTQNNKHKGILVNKHKGILKNT